MKQETLSNKEQNTRKHQKKVYVSEKKSDKQLYLKKSSFFLQARKTFFSYHIFFLAIYKKIRTRLVELVDTTDSKSVPNGYRFKSDNE